MADPEQASALNGLSLELADEGQIAAAPAANARAVALYRELAQATRHRSPRLYRRLAATDPETAVDLQRRLAVS